MNLPIDKRLLRLLLWLNKTPNGVFRREWDKMGMSKSKFNNWLRDLNASGKARASEDSLAKVCREIGTTPGALLLPEETFNGLVEHFKRNPRPSTDRTDALDDLPPKWEQEVNEELTGLIKVDEPVIKLDGSVSADTPESTPLTPRQAAKSSSALPSIFTLGMPVTGPTLYGRDEELRFLNASWDNSHPRVVVWHGWAGMGKSALLNTWLDQVAPDYRGAEKVFVFSFGTPENDGQSLSPDEFYHEALRFFGANAKLDGEPRGNRGQRLAELVAQHRSLVVIDAIESLQDSTPEDFGTLVDHDMAAFVRQFAASPRGLLIISSRHPLQDLNSHPSQAEQRQLERLPVAPGIEMLKQEFKIAGPDTVLGEIVEVVGGHGLSLRLIGGYLATCCRGDGQRFRGRDLVDIDMQSGGKAQRTLAWYDTWLKPVERGILMFIGVSLAPLKPEWLKALRAPPAIEGLNLGLMESQVESDDWEKAVANLRRLGLIESGSRVSGEALAAHALVRDYFGRKLRKECPLAWKEGHSRLFDHLRDHSDKAPATFEAMQPAFLAVRHGCLAEREPEALTLGFERVVGKGNAFVSTRMLGAIGATLDATAYFFEKRWGKPSSRLSPPQQAQVLWGVGFCLTVQGGLCKAEEPLESALEMAQEQLAYLQASRYACHLCDLLFAQGKLKDALDIASESIELVEKARKAGHFNLDEVNYESTRNQANYANVLHYLGRCEEARVAFQEAEKCQRKQLTSWPGAMYCDLLLEECDQPESEILDEVVERCQQALKSDEGVLFDRALDHLMWGRALAQRSQHYNRPEWDEAQDHLNSAVTDLRESGYQIFLPCGLLARAKFYVLRRHLDQAEKDLLETLELAETYGMRLHEADARLGLAQLGLARKHTPEAEKQFESCELLIQECNYVRKQAELAKIKQSISLSHAK